MEELKGIQSDTPLSRAFFSGENLNGLQTNLRYKVWTLSQMKHVIGTQDENELKVIMRSVFLQNALNQPMDILQQVLDLNNMVLEYCSQNILTQVTQYVAYNDHISQDRYVPEHSMSTSVRGSKQLELKPWF